MLGMKSSTSVSRSQPSGNTKKNRISQTTSSNKKNKVEDHPRSVKYSLNKKNHVSEPVCNANVKHSILNVSSELICVKCNECMFDAIHDLCVLDYVNDVNVRSKSKFAKRSKKRKVWKPSSKVFTNVCYRWIPTGQTFTIDGNRCTLTRTTSTNLVPPKIPLLTKVTTKTTPYRNNPERLKDVTNISFTAPSSPRVNFRFGNDKIAKIMGYGDYQMGNVTISRVYYVEGKLPKTLSLDESRSPKFDLFSEDEYSEEEVAETMAETIELNKPSGSITTWEDLKTKFLSEYCPPARTAKKIEDINSFRQEPDETLYQAWERFKELLMKCLQHYLTEMHEVILFYNELDVQTGQILDSKGSIPSKNVANAKVAIQEMDEYSQKWHNGTSRTRSSKTSDGLAAIQAQLNNLGREIKKVNEKFYAVQVGCEQCKVPHYNKGFPLKEEGKTLEEAYYTQFGRPFQGGGYRAAAPRFYQRNNANPSYQE
ncbi:hypothetical protein Tco_1043850 [Tanacetum coccineum]|uniref:Retrotransposon gag domain-containing protein n=1 Tax=Tanacetum coccineum TaxID=301880 RepID=A0ABQ5GNV8_9ASTR